MPEFQVIYQPCFVVVFRLCFVALDASWATIATILILRAESRSTKGFGKISLNAEEKSTLLGTRNPGTNTASSPIFVGHLLFPHASFGVDTRQPISYNLIQKAGKQNREEKVLVIY